MTQRSDAARARARSRGPGPRPSAGPRSRGRPGSAARSAAASAPADSGSPGGQPELLVDDVEAGDELGDAVLDLEPRVDLEEVEGPVAASRRNSAVAAFRSPAGGRDPDRQVVEVAPLVGVRPGAGASSTSFWWRRWSEQSRSPMATTAPGRVAQELDLDVARRPDLALEVDRAVAERRRRLGRPGRQRGRQVGGASHPAHPPSTTAGRGLDQQREADPLGLGDDRRPPRRGGRPAPDRASRGRPRRRRTARAVGPGACRRAPR